MDIFESTTPYPAATMPTARNIYTGTGENALYDVLEKAGVDLGELAHLFDYKRGVAEVTQALSESNEEFVEVRKQAAQLSDPDAIWALFEKHKTNVEARQMKSGAGKQMWQRAKPTLVNSQRNTILTECLRKNDENYEYALATTIAQYVRSNNFPAIEKHIQQQVKEGALDEGRAKALLNRAEIDIAARQHNLTVTAIGNPINAKKALKTFTNARRSGKRVDTFEGIDISKVEPTAYWSFINLAEGIIRDDETAAIEISTELKDDVLRKAQDISLSTKDFADIVLNQPGLTPPERDALIKIFLNSRKLWEEEHVNPFTTRQNDALYAQTMLDIDNKKIKTPQQIQQRMLEGNKVNFTPEDYAFLTGRLSNNKSEILKDDYVDEKLKMIDMMYMDENRNIPPKLQPEWAAAKKGAEFIFERIHADSPYNYVQMDKEVTEYLVTLKTKRARDWVEEFIDIARSMVVPYEMEGGFWPAVAKGTARFTFPRISKAVRTAKVGTTIGTTIFGKPRQEEQTLMDQLRKTQEEARQEVENANE